MKRSAKMLVLICCVMALVRATADQSCLRASKKTQTGVQYVCSSEGIGFFVDKGWQVTCSCDGSNGSRGCIGLRPESYLANRKTRPCDDSTWMIRIKVYKGGYEAWLKEGGFKQEGIRYRYTRNRDRWAENRKYASAIEGDGWSGILGERTMGCFDEKLHRFKVRAYDASTALISNGHKTAIIEFNDEYYDNKEYPPVFLRHFRFLR